MTFSRYLWLLILAGVAAAMAIAIVVMSALNERTQRDLQARQAALSNGVLGPQGQIGNAILQDMAAAAVTNRSMRALLQKHGYTIQPAAATPEVPND
jgi:glutaminase